MTVEPTSRRPLGRAVAALRRTLRPDRTVESNLVVLGVVGGFLFVSLVATLFLVQRALVGAQEKISTTALPTEQALGRLEMVMSAAFERQSKIASARSLNDLVEVSDRTEIERTFNAIQTLPDTGMATVEARALPAHARAFLDADRDLFSSVERRHALRAAFEDQLSHIEVDLAELTQVANALAGVLRLDHVRVLRKLAAQIADGAPSRALVRAEVLSGVQGRLGDVGDLVQAMVELGRMAARTGTVFTDDALNGIAANELPQNRSKIENLLSSLARWAPPGSDAGLRIDEIVERFRGVSPRISDESRPDSLLWLRRNVVAESAHGRRIQDACARSARLLSGDLVALTRASARQADAAVALSERTTRWARYGSLLVSLCGLLACMSAGLRIRDSVRALRTTNGELADLRDNLEHKVEKRTRELAASREQFRGLVETTKTIPFELAADGLGFRYIGPQALATLGVTQDACLAPGFLRDNLHPDDAERAVVALAGAFDDAATGNVDVELRIRRGEGGYIWIRLIATRATPREEAERSSAELDEMLGMMLSHSAMGPDNRTLRGVMLDVTQTRELEMQLRQAQKLESVGRLASGVAHEINTPVQFVNDNVHFLQDAFADLAALIDRYRALRDAVGAGVATVDMAVELRAAEEAADVSYVLESAPAAIERSIEGLGRIATIVRSMKEFAHPDQKEMTTIDLNQALTSTLTIARNEYKYVADIETRLGAIPPVTCHAGEMNQVFLNILVNAAHAIGDVVKGTEQKGRITVVSRCEGSDVVVSITDTGGGIPQAIRERIFDPFFTTKEVGKGTGQGLAIARAVVVDKHGGDIAVDSEIGKGTTFRIRLPVDGKLAVVLGPGAGAETMAREAVT